jgi:hypothetical protein
MKQFIGLLALLVSLPIMAQREVETSVTMKPQQDLFLNFKFAETIKVEQWDKQEVAVTATVTIDDGEGDSYFNFKTETSGSTVKVVSDYGDYFKNKSKKNQYGNCTTTTTIKYVVYVPRQVDMEVKSISGSLESNAFMGTLTTDLVSGDVTIQKFTGNLFLKSVSGDLDVAFQNADVDAQTLSGTIYSDLDIKRDTNKKSRSAYSKVVGTVNNGGSQVVLETVSGDIFMRKG